MAAALAVQAVAAIIVFLLVAGGRDGGLPSLTPIAEAAEHTAEYPGARMTLAGRFDVPGTDTVLKMHGDGEFNGTTGLSRARIAVDLPPEMVWRFPDGGLEVEALGDERPGRMVMYMRSASLGALPGGAEWMKLDLSEDVDTQSQSLDAREQLRMLSSSHGIERLGRETIRGVRTTRYHATIDQRAEVQRLRDEGKDSAADSLETVIAANDGAATTDVEVWIGPGPTIHRYRMTIPFALTAPAGSTMQMTVDLFDFGVEPDIVLPDDSEVFDATELARDELERLAE